MKKNLILTIFLFSVHFIFPQENTPAIDSIESLIKNTKDKDRVLVEKAALILKYYTSGQVEKSDRLCRETLSEAIRLNSQPGISAVYHTKGTLFYYTSQFDSALFYLEKALAIRKQINDNNGILKSTANIGAIYYMLSDYKKALRYFEEVMKKESELNYEEGEHLSINNLGIIYLTLNMHRKALHYFKKAEKIYSKKSKGDLIYTYDGISQVYKALNKCDSALYYGFKSKDLAVELDEEASLGYANHNIGTIYSQMKNYAESEKYFNESLKFSKQFNDKRLELAIYGNLALMEMDKKDSVKSLRYIHKIISMGGAQGAVTKSDLAGLFARYYYEKKQFQKAFDYLKAEMQYEDSIYSNTITGQLNEMQARYETEKKEKENRILLSDNQMKNLEIKTFKTTRNYLFIILLLALITIAGSYVAYKKISKTNILLSRQKQIVEEKQKEILDSIHYAKRIQYALLASDHLLKKNLPEFFVLFRPKDVVSGDFYWATETPDGFIYVTADCTGHGVPGAFMSLLNISKLSQSIIEHNITRPDLILNDVRAEIIKALNPENSSEESKDGMDVAVCRLNLKNMTLDFAAANNSFCIIRDNDILSCKADKMPVGMGYHSTSFTFNTISLKKGDLIYTYSDGYADQFGGTKGKKFKHKQLEELLFAIRDHSMEEQKNALESAFDKWKGGLEQVDDVCVIGIRV